MTALTASSTGGTVTGSLNLADPGSANDIPLVFDPISTPFNQTANVTIFGVSNGSGVAHSLTFAWSQTAFSPNGGDEAAIRLGGTSDDSTETAADYPGAPARVQAEDGHFVTVTLVSLCGNGVIDSGPSYTELCDDGPLTGTPASCCNANCTRRPAGTLCRPIAAACDVPESCTGSSGACPPDGVAPFGIVCRAGSAGEVCDVDESCDGSSPDCPPDLVAVGGTPCRAAAGACDVGESCDGAAKTCPADDVVADGTPCSDGQFCNGAETCQAGACSDAPNPCGGGCDEGLDQCFVGACAPQPQTTCRRRRAWGVAVEEQRRRRARQNAVEVDQGRVDHRRRVRRPDDQRRLRPLRVRWRAGEPARIARGGGQRVDLEDAGRRRLHLL